MNNQQPEGTDPVEAPEVTATPLPEPANSIESTERRQEITEQLRTDRQSTDPTVQAAASTLLRCDAPTDPLAGTDDAALPLVTCEPGTGQVYLLDPAPLLSGITDEDGPRLTGNEIDTDRPITGGFNPDSGQMEINCLQDRRRELRFPDLGGPHPRLPAAAGRHHPGLAGHLRAGD